MSGFIVSFHCQLQGEYLNDDAEEKLVRSGQAVCSIFGERETFWFLSGDNGWNVSKW